MFLSANDFFWKVVRRGDTLRRTGRWRDLGRPESALIGVEYRGNDRGQRKARGSSATPRLRRGCSTGSGLADGSPFRQRRHRDRPDHSELAARHPRARRDPATSSAHGFTAQMTYYETPAGAKVFAAGAFNLVRTILTDPVVGRLVANLWRRLADPDG